MKRAVTRILAIVTAAVMVLAITSGCGKDSDANETSDGKTILTLATYHTTNDIRAAVMEFNATSPDYYIQITDYLEFYTEDDRDAGIKRLSTEIISGKVPDILDVARLPYMEYADRGLLADLYPLMDADPEFSRSDMLESVLRASEIDGCLYQVFPFFFIETLITHPSVAGADMGWSTDEFAAVLGAHPGVDAPLGEWMTKMRFLTVMVLYSIDDYIDWGAGTAHFDSPAFIRLLELANSFPDDPDYNQSGDSTVYATEEETLVTGRQLMIHLQLYAFRAHAWSKAVFGGEVVYKGFPTESKSGNILISQLNLAISESSPHKEAAWMFIKTFLDKNRQIGSDAWGFPTNQEAFNHMAQTALNEDLESNSTGLFMMPRGSRYGFANINLQNLTQEDVDHLVAVINSASVVAGFDRNEAIMNIITEDVSDYFRGTVTAQRAAEVIQHRVSILISERS